ncbi:hypothetical protein [Streptomyces brasiliscabiei]|uniref:hypothetical protein n=1 Tax=Streptomyces brasiliscabiei TaxID=2736302 RepID=UPI001F315345|nr:hypothetical protein [Streptomyces brasiliscabiei]
MPAAARSAANAAGRAVVPTVAVAEVEPQRRKVYRVENGEASTRPDVLAGGRVTRCE